MVELQKNKTDLHGTVRAKTLAKYLDVGLSTVWKWAAEGKLPPSIKLSARTTVWRLSDVADFLEKQSLKNSEI